MVVAISVEESIQRKMISMKFNVLKQLSEKGQELMDLDLVINEIQNKLFL